MSFILSREPINSPSETTHLLRPRIRQTPHQVQDHRRHGPGDIEQRSKHENRPERQETSTHTLAGMMRHDMRNLMAQHGSQPVLVLADGQDTSVDEDLPSALESAAIRL